MGKSGRRVNHGVLPLRSICSSMIWLLLCVLCEGADQDPDPVNDNFNGTYSPLVGISTANVVLSNDDRLSIFKNLLDRAGVVPSLAKTIIAPSKGAWEAFEANDTRQFQQWTTQPEFFVHFRDLMEWHMIIEENYTYGEIFNGRRWKLQNPQGQNMVYQEPVQMIDNVRGSDFVQPNMRTAEGMIHVVGEVMLPPFFGYDMITQLLNSREKKFSFSTMANLALHVGLDDRINAWYEKGITFLVPPNRRFERAEIDVPRLLDKDMFNYTRDFVLCHMIKDNWHVAQLFAINEKTGVDQFLVKSELGTHMWITTTNEMVQFQSQELLVPDQPTPNGIFHGLDYPLFPPYITDFAFFTPLSTDIDTTDCFRLFAQCQLHSEDIAEIFNTTLTVFCPTREAFDKFNNEDFNRLLSPDWYRHACEFLLNHITAGDFTRNELVHQAPTRITMLNGQTYNLRKTGDILRIQNGLENARSHFGDLIALDGYLHTLDFAITPTAVSNNIYDWIQIMPETRILKINIDFVDLTDYIAKDYPLTVLAPDNAAFQRIEFDTLEGGPVLNRHIMRGLYFCDVLANQTEVVTVTGVKLSVELKGEEEDELWVGGAKIYNCDILAHNGVLHHIDRVIGIDFDSPAPTLSPAPTITGQPTASYAPSRQPNPLFFEEPDNGAVPLSLPPVLPPIHKIQKQPTAAPVESAGAEASFVAASIISVSCTIITLVWFGIGM